MKIRWAGHAQFVIETGGRIIVTDPPDASYGYPSVKEKVDFVTVSHEHADHNAVDTLIGNPKVFRGIVEYEDETLKIKAFPSFHDSEQGKLRGRNTIFRYEAEGLSIVHLGDLGEMIPNETADALGNVDVLMIPIGSVYTIDAITAKRVVDRIKPKIVLPMHYMTNLLSFTLDPPEKFTQLFPTVTYRPYLEIVPSILPTETKMVLLTL